jgi:hypothetical protein
MNPIVITWPSVTLSTAVIASPQAVTNGVTLTLNANNAVAYLPNLGNGQNVPGNLVPPYGTTPLYGVIPNLGTGGTYPVYQMPVGNVRSISITAATGSLGATQFSVIGVNQDGDILNVTGTPATIETFFFQTVISITPLATLAGGNTVEVGLGADGTTSLVTLDTWNKNNNYTIGYEVGSGSVSLTPYYTINRTYTYANGVQTPIETYVQAPLLYYVLPVGNANFINSPSSATTLPYTTASSAVAYSFVGIPMTGLLTHVSSSTASFTQTIIQQGGLV